MANGEWGLEETQHYATHAEQCREYARKYYAEHREECIAASRYKRQKRKLLETEREAV